MGCLVLGLGLWTALPAGATKPKPLAVPIIYQATDYSCGAAATLAVLLYWGVDPGPETGLYKSLKTTPEWGTPPDRIAAYLREKNLRVELKEGVSLAELQDALADGQTVILDIQAYREDASIAWSETWDYGHYVVLTALDEQRVFVMDPSRAVGYGFIPIGEFLERWHDYDSSRGLRKKASHLAIFASGEKPIASFPAPAAYIP